MPSAKKPSARRPRPARGKPATSGRTRGRTPAGARTKHSFPEALAAILQARSLPVPAGLVEAPPEAYAAQPPEYAQELARLHDAELVRVAAKIAGYADRQAERARAAWEASPLIAELRRRKLEEPPPPRRVVGANVSLKKPLSEWTDAELKRAARRWSSLGR